MKTQRTADLIIGTVLALLGVLVSIGALRIQDPSAASGLRSYTFPLLIGLLLLVTGGNLVIASWRSRETKQVEWPDRAGLRRMAVMMGSLALFVLLMDLIGFTLGAAVVTGFQVWYLGRDRWYKPVAAGLITGAVIYGVFIKLLELTLPTGPFN